MKLILNEIQNKELIYSIKGAIPNTTLSQWSKWDAYISNSYNLEIPYPEDSKEFQSAWIFIYWYIKKGFPQDWNFIGNKPKNVDWNLIDLEQLQSSGPSTISKTMAIQKDEWAKYPMNWYADMVKKVYNS